MRTEAIKLTEASHLQQTRGDTAVLMRIVFVHLICFIGLSFTSCAPKKIYVPPQSASGQDCIRIAQAKATHCENANNSNTDRCIDRATSAGIGDYTEAQRHYKQSRAYYQDCRRDQRRAQHRGDSDQWCPELPEEPRRSDYIKDGNCYYFWKHTFCY